MIIGTVKFPSTPDETVEKVKELKPLLDGYFEEVGEGNSSHLQTEMLVMFWHSAVIDFIEIVEGEERIGLMMLNLYNNPNTGKNTATISAFYIKPEHRGKGLFTEALKYAQTIFQARRYDELEFISRDLNKVPKIGEKVGVVYKIRL